MVVFQELKIVGIQHQQKYPKIVIIIRWFNFQDLEKLFLKNREIVEQWFEKSLIISVHTLRYEIRIRKLIEYKQSEWKNDKIWRFLGKDVGPNEIKGEWRGEKEKFVH